MNAFLLACVIQTKRKIDRHSLKKSSSVELQQQRVQPLLRNASARRVHFEIARATQEQYIKVESAVAGRASSSSTRVCAANGRKQQKVRPAMCVALKAMT